MNGQRKRIKGRVVLIKKNVLDFNDFWDSVLDRIHEFLDQKVTLYLISSLNTDPNAEPGTLSLSLINYNIIFFE